MFIIIVFKQTFCASPKSGGALVSCDFLKKLFLEDENDITPKMKGLKNFHKLFKKLNFAHYFISWYILDNYFIGWFYLLDIFFYLAVFILVPSMAVEAVSRTILFKHMIWNSEFEVMYFISFNLSPNRLLHSQQYLHSCTLIVKAIPHLKPEHQWRFSSRL